MAIEWLADPTIWFGLFTLVTLEIVLGIDNLIFIAILADKLPPNRRDRARIIGLGLALFMRVGLLFSISWLVSLTDPWIEIFDKSFSGRDAILLGGGLFLIFKATMELHERLEGHHQKEVSGPKTYAGFWSIILQIVALDAVFSLDSVITAVGMADELSVMVAAVVIAVLMMMVASKPLTIFINQHPTLIVLCLGFLLMIGCSLIAEGFGFHIPKGYLYAAIGFSVLVELFNQVARAKRKKALVSKKSLRGRTADAVLRLLGAKTDLDSEDLAVIASAGIETPAFNSEERYMISSVLGLAELSAKSIMTYRKDLHTIYINDDIETAKEKLSNSPFSRMIVVKDALNEAVGFVQKKDILNAVIKGKEFSALSVMQQPLIIPENKSVLDILGNFKKTGIQIAFVLDIKGHFAGIITLTDVMEAIAGDIPEEYEATSGR